MSRPNAYDRLESIDTQYRVASFALRRLTDGIANDPGPLRRERLSMQDVRVCRLELPNTYVVRLFSEFEATLRSISHGL